MQSMKKIHCRHQNTSAALSKLDCSHKTEQATPTIITKKRTTEYTTTTKPKQATQRAQEAANEQESKQQKQEIKPLIINMPHDKRIYHETPTTPNKEVQTKKVLEHMNEGKNVHEHHIKKSTIESNRLGNNLHMS